MKCPICDSQLIEYDDAKYNQKTINECPNCEVYIYFDHWSIEFINYEYIGSNIIPCTYYFIGRKSSDTLTISKKYLFDNEVKEPFSIKYMDCPKTVEKLLKLIKIFNEMQIIA